MLVAHALHGPHDNHQKGLQNSYENNLFAVLLAIFNDQKDLSQINSSFNLYKLLVTYKELRNIRT